MRQPQQSLLLEDKAGANKDAGGARQDETYVEVSHTLWRLHCVCYVALTGVGTKRETRIHALKIKEQNDQVRKKAIAGAHWDLQNVTEHNLD